MSTYFFDLTLHLTCRGRRCCDKTEGVQIQDKTTAPAGGKSLHKQFLQISSNWKKDFRHEAVTWIQNWGSVRERDPFELPIIDESRSDCADLPPCTLCIINQSRRRILERFFWALALGCVLRETERAHVFINSCQSQVLEEHPGMHVVMIYNLKVYIFPWSCPDFLTSLSWDIVVIWQVVMKQVEYKPQTLWGEIRSVFE